MNYQGISDLQETDLLLMMTFSINERMNLNGRDQEKYWSKLDQKYLLDKTHVISKHSSIVSIMQTQT